MVIVRESPRAKRSPDKNEAQWPPKSPFEALLSSPSGRKKWQDHQSRSAERSVSPSPIRKSTILHPKLEALANEAGMDTGSDNGDEDEDEDEEILRLKLQQIEAKLKLKRLQRERKTKAAVEADDETRPPASRPVSSILKDTSPERRPQPSRQRTRVEVPLSPVKDERLPRAQASPARVKLGLLEARRPEEVSLKRPRDSKLANLTNSRASTTAAHKAEESKQTQSFSAKLAGIGRREVEAEARQERLDSVRSSAFGRTVNVSGPRSRGGGASGQSKDKDTKLPSNTSSLAKSASTRSLRTEPIGRPLQRDPLHNPTEADGADDSEEASGGSQGYDSFSQIHLSKREISHADVAREMAGKEIYPLPRLLREVVSPSYEAPDCEADYVVFAILASKSNPYDQIETHKQTDGHKPDKFEAPRNKFMVLHLCDLKWEVDLFLFGTAFNQFWKLTPGTLLAILNPAIMPPKGNKDSGNFSLKLGSCDDAIMEIGTARDLGYCVSVKKDGSRCSTWIDKRKTEVCDYHLNLQIEKSRKNRIEVNSSWTGAGLENRIKSREAKAGRGKQKDGSTYHREYGRMYSMNNGWTKSAAGLLDAEDVVQLDAEASRKQIAAAERERELAKKLAALGSGAGAEYLRVKHPKTAHDTDGNAERQSFFPTKPSAAALGLTANDVNDVRLSPAKDRKRHFGIGTINKNSGGREAMGWGGARKAGLLQPKDGGRALGSPERGQTRLSVTTHTASQGIVRPRSQDGSLPSPVSPRKKKARFALEKGVREPGRESLPGEADRVQVLDMDDDDDDDLDII